MGSSHPGRCPEGRWRQYFRIPNPGCACQEKTFGGIDVMCNYIDGLCTDGLCEVYVSSSRSISSDVAAQMSLRN